MLSRTERADALRELTAIARDAAAVLMTGWRTPAAARVEYKGAVDLVTEFDLRSETLVRERAARSFAGCDVIAEERGGVASGARPVIYADPLDGTTNFAHGHPFFAVSIALVDAGVPEVGVVVAPALGWTYGAARELGATRNGERCAVSAVEALGRAMLATGFPYDRATSSENNLRAFVEVKKRAQAVRRCGAAALDLCMVADGTYDGYWERKLKAWDVSAGIVLVREAGGRVTGLGGGDVRVDQGEVVATNGAVHDELVSALTRAAEMADL